MILRIAIPVTIWVRFHIDEEELEDILESSLHFQNVGYGQAYGIVELLLKIEYHDQWAHFNLSLYFINIVLLHPVLEQVKNTDINQH